MRTGANQLLHWHLPRALSDSWRLAPTSDYAPRCRSNSTSTATWGTRKILFPYFWRSLCNSAYSYLGSKFFPFCQSSVAAEERLWWFLKMMLTSSQQPKNKAISQVAREARGPRDHVNFTYSRAPFVFCNYSLIVSLTLLSWPGFFKARLG